MGGITSYSIDSSALATLPASAFFLLLSLVAPSTSAGNLPFAYFHGHGSSCEAESILWKYFVDAANTQGECIEIGNGAEDSRNLTMWKQAEIGCKNVSSNPLFAGGLNLVGISQGGLLARTILQTCDTLPPVNNLISVGSPQMGIASYPHCAPQLLPLPCRVRSAAAHRVYREPGYDNSSAAGYFKVPTALPAYYKNNNFLKYINNELPSARNETYKKRVKRLNTLVLIKVKGGRGISIINPAFCYVCGCRALATEPVRACATFNVVL